MTHLRPTYMNSIISVLGCTSDEYWSVYESLCSTYDLAENVKTNVIKNCEMILSTENSHYELDTFLYTMLNDAPHPAGKRYVAVALHIAYTTKGETAVVELANVWMYSLFLPMFALSRLIDPRGNRSYSALGDIDEPTNDFKTQLIEREEHRCAITKRVDSQYLQAFMLSGRSHEAPEGPKDAMVAAYIIPPKLIDSSRHSGDGIPSTAPTRNTASTTLDLFRAWTQIEASDLTTEILNSPANGVFMTVGDYDDFKDYLLYFDKDAYPESPHKYKVRVISDRIALSNGATTSDVEFRTLEESGVEPPNPLFLKAHAAFAKVLYRCGAGQYYHLLLYRSEQEPMRTVDTGDGAALLTYKLCSHRWHCN